MAQATQSDIPNGSAYIEIPVSSDGESEGEKTALLKEGEAVVPDSAPPRRSYRLSHLILACIGGLLLVSFTSSQAGSGAIPLSLSKYAISGTASRASVSLLNSLTGYIPLFGRGAAQSEVHPILPLLRQARKAHERMMGRQSTTLAQAEKTYAARYGRKPPPGFASWWTYARERNHTLVDEYDGVMLDIAGFEELSPEVLRTRTATLGHLPGVSIISIKDGAAQVHSRSGRWAPALAFQEMIDGFVKQLPDMDIAVNERLEARILPELRREVRLSEWGEVEGDEAVNMTDPLAARLPFRVEWKSDGNVWEVYRRACPPDSAARRLIESIRSAEARQKPRTIKGNAATTVSDTAQGETTTSRRRSTSGVVLPPAREVTFVSHPDSGLDICARPSMHGLHSAFFSDTRSIPYLYPLFSPSKPSGFADILVPSHHYWNPSSEYTYDWELKKGRTRTSADLEWAEKDDKAFWRGKVTRGADTPEGHSMTFQKQRLVTLANDDGGGLRSTYESKRLAPLTLTEQPRRVLVALNASSSALRSISAPLGAINNVTLDVAMACDPKLGECIHQSNLGLRVEAPGPLSDVWKHKYALDLDEVGFSPRFFALMESKCAVVKSTIQREFWTGWSIPWYHFIPLSTSFGELHNIQAFFTGLPAALVDESKAEAERIVAERAAAEKASTPPAAKGKKGSKTTSSSKSTAPPRISTPQFVMTELELDLDKPVVPLDPAHGPVFSGDAALRGIAEHGAQWRREIVRREDMEVYVYRVLLEYARLLSDDR